MVVVFTHELMVMITTVRKKHLRQGGKKTKTAWSTAALPFIIALQLLLVTFSKFHCVSPALSSISAWCHSPFLPIQLILFFFLKPLPSSGHFRLPIFISWTLSQLLSALISSQKFLLYFSSLSNFLLISFLIYLIFCSSSSATGSLSCQNVWNIVSL